MHDVACKKCPTANVRKGLNATWVFSLEIGVKLFMVRKLSTWDLDIFGQSAFQCILSKVLMATCVAGSLFGVATVASTPLPGQTPVPQASRNLQDDSFYKMALKSSVRQGDCDGACKPMCEDALDSIFVCSSMLACSLTSVLCSFSLFCGFVCIYVFLFALLFGLLFMFYFLSILMSFRFFGSGVPVHKNRVGSSETYHWL